MILPYAVAAFTTRRLLQRECPNCGHVQLVPPNKVCEVVTCEHCNYGIPPKRRIAA